MELKRIVAENSNAALNSVKSECGEDALIVSTNKIGQKTEVIYAVKTDDLTEGHVESSVVAENPLKGRDFARVIDNELTKSPSNKTPAMRDLLSEIQTEIRFLREKLSETTQELSDTGAIKFASDLASKSVRETIENLQKDKLQNQRSWSGLTIIINFSRRPNNDLTEELLKCMARSIVTSRRQPILARVLDHPEDQSLTNSGLIEASEAAKRSNANFLIAPDLSSMDAIFDLTTRGIPVLLQLPSSSIDRLDILSPLVEELNAKVLFSIDCEQRASAISEELLRIPEKFRSLLLYTSKTSKVSDDVCRTVGSTNLKVSAVATSLGCCREQ